MVKNHTVLPVAALYENQAMMLVCRLTGAETVLLTRAGGASRILESKVVKK
jgi:hypothetical protein